MGIEKHKSAAIIPKRQRSNEEKQSHVQAWKQSGLNCRSYCQKNGLAIPTFSRWAREAKGKNNSSPMSFISLPLKKEDEIDKQSVEIKLANGILCRFPQVTNTASIKQLIQALQDVITN